MFFIASTRFNESTWKENLIYRKANSIKGAIYGVSIKIHKKYPLKSILFVIEMNNDTNKICGIGIIRNSIHLDKRYIIYEQYDYNRFIYLGDYWISREDIQEYDKLLLEILENMLFKGKSHLKRQSGISIVTSKLFMNWKYNENSIKESIKELFISKFKNTDL